MSCASGRADGDRMLLELYGGDKIVAHTLIYKDKERSNNHISHSEQIKHKQGL